MVMFGLMLLLQAASDAPVQAAATTQSASVPEGLPDPALAQCKVISQPLDAKLVNVFVSCGKYVRILGAAESFTSASYVGSGGTIVVVRRGGLQQLLLISPTAGEAHRLDDITGDIAESSGRNADSGLPVDVVVDISGFAVRGTVKVPALPKRQGLGLPIKAAAKYQPAADPVGGNEIVSVDLGGYAALARPLKAGIPARPMPAPIRAPIQDDIR